MSDTIIKLENISKQYRLGTVGTQTLRGDFQRWWHRMAGKEDPTLKIGASNKLDAIEGEYVWALKDINLEVKQGEVLGIIGKNGAGKSTLLKLLSRVTGPTTGQIKVKGRIASLLEVGTGFHPELTGRENIFLNGAILGMTKNDIRQKFDEIVDFAGVAKYIDTPVKRYSSGMYVRLAFAVAAHLEPDILVVDEVLAVGDAEFQKKAIGKMQDVSTQGGRTVLFVSHNMGLIQNICTKTVILRNGENYFEGGTKAAIKEYQSTIISSNKSYIAKEEKDIYINSVEPINESSQNQHSFTYDQDVKFEIAVTNNSEKHIVNLGVAVKGVLDQKIFTTIKNDIKQCKERKILLSIPQNTLLPGKYSLDVALFVPKLTNFEYLKSCCSFEVLDSGSEFSIYEGSNIGQVNVNCNWS